MKQLLFATLLLVTTTSYSKTYDLSGRWGLGLGAGQAYPILENQFDERFNEQTAWNLHYRYQVSDAKAWVFSFSRLEFDETTFATKVYDLMYLIRTSPVDRLTPILGVGAGAADYENAPNGDTSTNLTLKARAGFEYAITDDLFASATVDYQYLNDFPESDGFNKAIGEIHAITPQVNLTLFFGHDKEKSEKSSAPVTAAAPPVAPSTTNTNIIHTNPTPAPVVAVSPGKEPRDADNDGVIDAKDKCPGTEANLVVNNYGCVPKQKAQIEVEVFFDTAKASLNPNSYKAMEELAQFLKENSDTKAEIQGHTDNVGPDKMNKDLSQKRADVVKAYLIEKLNVPAGRLTSVGYGEEKPIDDNATPTGREKNRRVVAEITEQ